MPYDSSKEPWLTACWLAKFRNKIAHAKPEFVTESFVWTREKYDHKKTTEPKSKLEKEITIGNAKRTVKRVTEIKDLFCLNIAGEVGFSLHSDGWSGSAEIIQDT